MSQRAGATVDEPGRRVPVIREAEVVVLGGGPSGLAAAVAAARLGARTLLVERYGFLGGMGTAAMVTNFCGLFAEVQGDVRRVVRGVADDVLGAIDELGGLNRPQGSGATTVQAYDTAAYKCAADRLVQAAGVDLLLHTLAVGAITSDVKPALSAAKGRTLDVEGGSGVVRRPTSDVRRIDALLIETKSGRAAVRGQVFVDCSGDADLAVWAGAPFEKGADDGYLAYPTMMFRMGGVDSKRAEAEALPVLREYAEDARARGELGFMRASPVARAQAHPGEWRLNMTQVTFDGGPVDGTNVEHLTRAELIGRSHALAASRFLRERVPGFERSYLLEIAPQIGIRETRRIVGQYVLTADDVRGGVTFEDAIGCTGWPVEKHVLGGVEWTPVGGRGFYQIPYRSLLPREVDNLLVAGRCLSASQDAQASARVSGPCFAMGQAAGTAAVLSLRRGTPPANLDIRALCESLLSQDVELGESARTERQRREVP